MRVPVLANAAAVVRAAAAGSAPLVLARAPGRVNLIGEHTDYNGLPVLPMAIDRAVWVAARTIPEPHVHATNLDPTFGARDFAWQTSIAPSPAGDWANYVKTAVQTAAALLPDHGPQRGVALTIGSDLPVAAGLSSSSALMVGVTLAALASRGAAFEPVALAERLAVAERYVGILSGGMDQAVILLAEAGSALRLDFFPLRATPVPMPSGCAVIVADSLVRAEKSAGARAAYNRRVVECRLACRLLERALGVQLTRLGDLVAQAAAPRLIGYLDALAARVPDAPLSLAEIARAAGTIPSQLASLLADDAGRPLDLGRDGAFRPLARARHVLSEADRVVAAVLALTAAEPATVGALMTASHQSCRNDYEITVPALDTLVEIAEEAGAFGARMTGAGFGGAVVAFTPETQVESVLAALDTRFYRPRLGAGDPRQHRFVFAPAAGATVTPADAL